MPDVFVVGDYTATAVDRIGPDRLDLLQAVARDCPVDAISIVQESGDAPAHDDEKGQYEEKYGQIRKHEREDSGVPYSHNVEPNHTERFKRGEHNFTVVRNGSHDDEHPRRVSRL